MYKNIYFKLLKMFLYVPFSIPAVVHNAAHTRRATVVDGPPQLAVFSFPLSTAVPLVLSRQCLPCPQIKVLLACILSFFSKCILNIIELLVSSKLVMCTVLRHYPSDGVVQRAS